MALTDRQKITIKNLERGGITNPHDIILWAEKTLKRPRKTTNHPGRRHGRNYFRQIIKHYTPFK